MIRTAKELVFSKKYFMLKLMLITAIATILIHYLNCKIIYTQSAVHKHHDMHKDVEDVWVNEGYIMYEHKILQDDAQDCRNICIDNKMLIKSVLDANKRASCVRIPDDTSQNHLDEIDVASRLIQWGGKQKMAFEKTKLGSEIYTNGIAAVLSDTILNVKKAIDKASTAVANMGTCVSNCYKIGAYIGNGCKEVFLALANKASSLVTETAVLIKNKAQTFCSAISTAGKKVTEKCMLVINLGSDTLKATARHVSSACGKYISSFWTEVDTDQNTVSNSRGSSIMNIITKPASLCASVYRFCRGVGAAENIEVQQNTRMLEDNDNANNNTLQEFRSEEDDIVKLNATDVNEGASLTDIYTASDLQLVSQLGLNTAYGVTQYTVNGISNICSKLMHSTTASVHNIYNWYYTPVSQVDEVSTQALSIPEMNV